jgi:hypothetical protein
MRTIAKVGLTALIAALLLSAALSTASARRLELSNQRFRVAWSRLEFQSAFLTGACQVTLEGSFHSATIPKMARLLIGAITRVNIKKESCTNGEALVDSATLPGHITYESFTGTLPSISSVRLLLTRFTFWVATFGARCTYGTSTGNMTFSANLTAGEITTLTPVAGSNTASLLEGGGLCPGSVSLLSEATDGTLTVLNSAARIRIRLI